MRLIRHDDDIPTIRKRLITFLKFLHGCEDDAVCLTVCKQFFQVGSALGVLRRLAQEVLAAGELAVELVIQVIAVCDHNDCRAFQCFLQIVSIEHHRQRFSAALRVPEHAAFAIRDGCLLGGSNRLLDGEILMVGGKHFECLLAVHIEADKVFQDVEETVLLKQSLKEGVKGRVLCVLIAAIRCFPLHEAVFTGGDGSSL